MKGVRRIVLGIWAVLSLLPGILGLASCTGPGTHTVYLQFRPTAEPPSYSGYTVGIAPFQDPRSSPQTLGRRIRVDGTPETIVLGSPSPSKDLTYVLIRFLESKGFRVVDLPSWRPDPDTLKDLPSGVRMAITGRIDALEVESDSTLWRTWVRYRIKLTGFFGIVDRAEVLTRSVEIAPQRTSLQFDLRGVEEDLNRALTEAISRLLEGVLPASP